MMTMMIKDDVGVAWILNSQALPAGWAHFPAARSQTIVKSKMLTQHTPQCHKSSSNFLLLRCPSGDLPLSTLRALKPRDTGFKLSDPKSVTHSRTGSQFSLLI